MELNNKHKFGFLQDHIKKWKTNSINIVNSSLMGKLKSTHFKLKINCIQTSIFIYLVFKGVEKNLNYGRKRKEEKN